SSLTRSGMSLSPSAAPRSNSDDRSSTWPLPAKGLPTIAMAAARITGCAAARPASASTSSFNHTTLRRPSIAAPLFAISEQRRSLVQPRNQCGGVPSLAAHLLHVGIELVDQRGDRQLGAVLARFTEADRQVLAHPVDREAEVELAGVHGLVAVLHLPGLRRPLGNGFDHRIDVEPGLLREMDAFGEPLHQPGDADLIDHLGELPGAGGPQQ